MKRSDEKRAKSPKPSKKKVKTDSPSVKSSKKPKPSATATDGAAKSSLRADDDTWKQRASIDKDLADRSAGSDGDAADGAEPAAAGAAGKAGGGEAGTGDGYEEMTGLVLRNEEFEDGNTGGSGSGGVRCLHEVAYPKGWKLPTSKEAARKPLPEKPAKEYPFKLDPFQEEAREREILPRPSLSLLPSSHTQVSAHTSAGKTVVAEYAIAMVMRDNQRVVYTSPIKPLPLSFPPPTHSPPLTAAGISTHISRQDCGGGIRHSHGDAGQPVRRVHIAHQGAEQPKHSHFLPSHFLFPLLTLFLPFPHSLTPCVHYSQVSAHTSAGKTVVAEYAIAMAMRDNQRVVYTSPIKALSNQKFREMSQEFGDVGLMTGDVTIAPNATCLVMTTEILRSMLYRGSDFVREVGWIIFDEVHYLRDKERGVVWEESIVMAPKSSRFVFLSATVPNAREFAEWVAKVHQQPCHIVYTDYRPTPLQHYIFPAGGMGLFLAVDEKGKFREASFQKAMNVVEGGEGGGGKGEDGEDGGKKGGKWGKGKRGAGGGGPGGAGGGGGGKKGEESDIYKIVKMIMQRQYDPVIVFSFSRADCEALALQMSRMDLNDDDEKTLIDGIFRNAIDSLAEEDKKLPQVGEAASGACVKLPQMSRMDLNDDDEKTLIDGIFRNAIDSLAERQEAAAGEGVHEEWMSRMDLNDDDEKTLIDGIFRNAIDSLAEEDKKLPQVNSMLPLLRRGIGIHHSGLLPLLKEVIEILFQEGLLKCLFATETFSIGLNMPAKTVVFTNVRKWDGTKSRWLSGGEYIQMSGRAGRRGLDDRGICILMVDSRMEPAVAKGMVKGSADPLVSRCQGDGQGLCGPASEVKCASCLIKAVYNPPVYYSGICILMVDSRMDGTGRGQGDGHRLGMADPFVSAFHLSYNFILNQLRSPEVEIEQTIRSSYRQFQSDRALPALQERLQALEAEHSTISIPDESSLLALLSLRRQLSALRAQIRSSLTTPSLPQPNSRLSLPCPLSPPNRRACKHWKRSIQQSASLTSRGPIGSCVWGPPGGPIGSCVWGPPGGPIGSCVWGPPGGPIGSCVWGPPGGPIGSCVWGPPGGPIGSCVWGPPGGPIGSCVWGPPGGPIGSCVWGPPGGPIGSCVWGPPGGPIGSCVWGPPGGPIGSCVWGPPGGPIGSCVWGPPGGPIGSCVWGPPGGPIGSCVWGPPGGPIGSCVWGPPGGPIGSCVWGPPGGPIGSCAAEAAADVAYDVDILTRCVEEGSAGRMGPPGGPRKVVRPCRPGEEGGNPLVASFPLTQLDGISAVRLFLPKDLKHKEPREAALKSLQQLLLRAGADGVQMLDPEEDME
ncbi:unnamed protein product, partial [Closterium sp. NIES-65]